MTAPDTPAIRAVAASGVPHRVIQYGKVAHIGEASQRSGIPVARIMKSLVVRTGEDAFVIVVVPGDRVIDWPKLRSLLGESRMSLAPADEAYDVTGYLRGAITPFGSRRDLPTILDAAASGEISIGGGAHGVAIVLDAADVARATGATVADVTRPA